MRFFLCYLLRLEVTIFTICGCRLGSNKFMKFTNLQFFLMKFTKSNKNSSWTKYNYNQNNDYSTTPFLFLSTDFCPHWQGLYDDNYFLSLCSLGLCRKGNLICTPVNKNSNLQPQAVWPEPCNIAFPFKNLWLVLLPLCFEHLIISGPRKNSTFLKIVHRE